MDIVQPEHLSPGFAALADNDRPGEAPSGASRPSDLPLDAAVARLEREMIRNALDRCEGNISETARLLGLTRRGLYLKMKRLGVD